MNRIILIFGISILSQIFACNVCGNLDAAHLELLKVAKNKYENLCVIERIPCEGYYLDIFFLVIFLSYYFYFIFDFIESFVLY